MNSSTTIVEIRQRHEEVYGNILKDASLVRSGPRRDAFLAERVYPLLNDLKVLPTAGMSVEDYAWLSDTAIQWQVVFSSVFNIPRTVQIATPQQLNPPTENYTSETLDDLLKREAFSQSQARMLGGLAEYIRHYRSTPVEMVRDWQYAKVVLANWLLEGQINFARQIPPESYHYAEEVWLEELRRDIAYFHWVLEERILWNHEADLHHACMHIRGQLTNPNIKASRRDFVAVQEYIETRYLTDGRLDPTKPAAVDLIRRKAHRLWEKTGESDADTNWHKAEAYVEKFYEHIVPAVLENKVQSIEAVLNAFQVWAEPAHDAVVNCFEVIVAAYFLDPHTLKKQLGELVHSAL